MSLTCLECSLDFIILFGPKYSLNGHRTAVFMLRLELHKVLLWILNSEYLFHTALLSLFVKGKETFKGFEGLLIQATVFKMMDAIKESGASCFGKTKREREQLILDADNLTVHSTGYLSFPQRKCNSL